MISKELLSAVYPIDETTETYVGIQESTGRVMWFGKEYNDCRSEIDIHRVAHKCKEWASINSYALESSVHMQPKRSSVAGCQIHWRYETEDLPYFEAGSEPEAIFKACQWILDKDSK